MGKKKTLSKQLIEYELANASYEYINNQIGLKEYQRHKKIQNMIHKRKGWKEYIR